MINTPKIQMINGLTGIKFSNTTTLLNARLIKRITTSEIGIPIISDFNPYNKLSYLIILLNPFGVSPILLSTANSFLLKAMEVLIVLNTLVTPIKVTKVIKPYNNILINKI